MAPLMRGVLIAMNTAPPRCTRSTGGTTCSVSRAPFLLLLGVAALSACDKFNQPAQPCPEIPAAAFESALSAGDTRGEIEVSGSGLVSSQFGGSMKTCRKDKTALTGEVCRRSRDLVVRYQTAERGLFYVKVPAGRWHRFDGRYHPGACTLLP